MSIARSNKVLLATSTKNDGNMSLVWGDEAEVVKNRERFLGKYDLSPHDCVVMQVEHGDAVTVVGPEYKGRTVPAEAFVTQDKNLILWLLTADCLPIAFFDPKQEVIALAHLGWKPTDLRLAKKVISTMVKDFKSDPADILVYIGPGIHKESYAFENPAQQNIPEWAPFLREDNGVTHIDLVGYNKAQMVEFGVLEQNISVDPVNTATSDTYFSHYRSSRTREPEGRFATILAMK